MNEAYDVLKDDQKRAAMINLATKHLKAVWVVGKAARVCVRFFRYI